MNFIFLQENFFYLYEGFKKYFRYGKINEKYFTGGIQMGTTFYTILLLAFFVVYMILFFMRIRNPYNYKLEAGLHFGMAFIWIIMLLGRVQNGLTSTGGKIVAVMGLAIVVISVLNGLRVIKNNKN